jgi:NADPH:quinone reductase
VQDSSRSSSHEADFDLLIEKRIGPINGCRFPLAEAAAAQRYLIEEGPFGRVLLSL